MRIDLQNGVTEIDLVNGETLWVQGDSVLIGNEESLVEGACVFLEDATKVAGGELMSKVRRLEAELTEVIGELKVMAMR